MQIFLVFKELSSLDLAENFKLKLVQNNLKLASLVRNSFELVLT